METLDDRLRDAEKMVKKKMSKIQGDLDESEHERHVTTYVDANRRKAVMDYLDSLDSDDGKVLVGFAQDGQDLRTYAKPIIKRSEEIEDRIRENKFHFYLHRSEDILAGEEEDLEKIQFFSRNQIYDLKKKFKSRFIIPKPLANFSNNVLNSKYFGVGSILGGVASVIGAWVIDDYAFSTSPFWGFGAYIGAYALGLGALHLGKSGDIDNFGREREGFLEDLEKIQKDLYGCFN